MKNVLILFMLWLSLSDLPGQRVGINNVNPQATLDIKGALRVRAVSLSPVNDYITLHDSIGYLVVINVSAPFYVVGGEAYSGRKLTIENNNGFVGELGNKPTIIAEGTHDYIVNEANEWVRVGPVENPSWSLGGNFGVTPPFNSLGTNDNVDMIIKTNNGERVRIKSNGNVGIGTAAATEKLDVNGNIKTTGEIMPAGNAGQVNQVLTSNGNGTMQWASMSAPENGAGAGAWSDWCTDNINEFFPVARENSEASDFFGGAVAIDGNYAIIGAPAADYNGFLNTGMVFFYERNPANNEWTQVAEFANQNSQAVDNFGNSVSISGNFAAVGAPYDDELSITNLGSVTIFKRNASGVWQAIQKIFEATATENSLYGASVSISGDHLWVGAQFADIPNAGTPDNGAVFTYKRNATSGIWEWVSTIEGGSVNDYFGSSVCVRGDRAIGSSRGDDENGFTDCGSVNMYIYDQNLGWVNQGKVINPYPANFDQFGRNVSISGEFAAVGAEFDDGATYTNNGAVYLYKRNASNNLWELHTEFVYPGSNSNFGRSVCLNGDYLAVGAYLDDFDSKTDNGSAYLFRRYGNTWSMIQHFTHPNSVNLDRFGSSVCIDKNTRRFIIGSEGVDAYRGMAFFGKIK